MRSTATAWRDPLARLPLIAPHPCQAAAEGALSPPLSSPDASNPPPWRDLFGKVEWALETYSPKNRDDDTAAVLCAFLQHLSGQGRSALMSDIVRFATPDAGNLRGLRDFLVDAILKPLTLASLANTPKVHANAQAQRSKGVIEDPVPVDLGAVQRAVSSVREDCLDRDGDRCIATSLVDWARHPPTNPHANISLLHIGPTYCTHILPFALSNEASREVRLAVHDIETTAADQDQSDDKATIWWALYRYFPFLREKIASDSINKPHNAVTIGKYVFPYWALFDLALEPVCAADNSYRWKCFDEELTDEPELQETVTWEQHAAVPLPDPDFFRFHLQLAKILDETGIRRKISRVCSENQAEAVKQYSIAADGSTDIGQILRKRMLLDI